MAKKTHDFAKISEFKDRFRKLSVAQLHKKQALGFLQKEAASAIRQLLKEKHEIATDHFDWQNIEAQQRQTCRRFDAEYLSAPPELKVGVALTTIGAQPLNALLHLPSGDTSGWYIWAGEELNHDPQFFQPVHMAHLRESCPELLPYLGRAPGWRVLIAPNHEDVWFDSSIVA